MFEPLHDNPDLRHGDHRHFVVRGGEIFVSSHRKTASARALHTTEVIASFGVEPAGTVLGRVDGVTYWVIDGDDLDEPPAPDDDERNVGANSLRALHSSLPAHEWNIAGRATQILDWLRDHRFCGRCGTANQQIPGERAMRCPIDGTAAYPRLSPAVIVLIEREDGRALLGRSGRWDTPMYSTLAGFVEPGESLEDTVHREVFEEVGVRVGAMRYFASQPWPFPNSLMLGFVAQWTEGNIEVDGEEIADAQWFHHDDLPMIPPKMSIARALIDDWIIRVGGTPQ